MRQQCSEYDEVPQSLADHGDLEFGREASSGSHGRAVVSKRFHVNNWTLAISGCAIFFATGIIWCAWTSDEFSTTVAELHLSRIAFAMVVLVALWWSQRDRARNVAILIQQRIPKYTRRIPRIVITIEHQDELDDAVDGLVRTDLEHQNELNDEQGRSATRLAFSPLRATAIGNEDFLSCCGDTPTSAAMQPIFPRVPQMQYDTQLKHVSRERIQNIRDVAEKLKRCDSVYCAALRKMGVDPEVAILEFGQHFNGYDIGAYRFLSGNGWDVPLAEQKILNTIRWRTLELPKYMENPQFLTELIAHRLLPNIGWDEQSRGRFASDRSPIEYWAIQLVNMKKAYDLLGEAGIRAGYVQYLETREATVRGAESLGMFVIIDCINARIGTMLWQVSYFTRFVSFVGAVGEVYYPEAMTKCVLANAPPLVDALWNVAKGVLSEATKDKIVISSSMGPVEDHCDMRDIEYLKQAIIAGAKEHKTV